MRKRLLMREVQGFLERGTGVPHHKLLSEVQGFREIKVHTYLWCVHLNNPRPAHRRLSLRGLNPKDCTHPCFADRSKIQGPHTDREKGLPSLIPPEKLANFQAKERFIAEICTQPPPTQPCDQIPKCLDVTRTSTVFKCTPTKFGECLNCTGLCKVHTHRFCTS